MKLSLEQLQKKRAEGLMYDFFEYENKWKEAIAKGKNFLDCHDIQIVAADIIGELEDAGLLHIAKEMYPHEKEVIEQWLECYREIQSGVKI